MTRAVFCAMLKENAAVRGGGRWDMEQTDTRKQIREMVLLVGFGIIMMALGASDAMRGVLAPVFSDHFGLDASGVSAIVTAGYIGNFVFLLVGGKVMDRFSVRAAQLFFWGFWMASLLLMTFTDSFVCLLLGLAGAMGASTMLNTSIGLTVPSMSTRHPVFLINLLFFVQGIGTSTGQSVVGNWVQNFGQWHWVTAVLLAIGLAAGAGLLLGRHPAAVPRQRTRQTVSVWRDSRFYLLVCIFGCYFIAEHGMMNWFVSYGVSGMGMEKGSAANITALFFAGIMLGRLVFSPLADRLGPGKSIITATALAFFPYLAGVLLEENGLWLLAASGLAFAVVYPTLVLSIRGIWDLEEAGGVSGKILSIASLADIGFNAAFGGIVEAVGYRSAFLLMPVSMGLCLVLSVWFFSKDRRRAE